MANHAKRIIKRRGKQKPVKAFEGICKVCNGRGYTLVPGENIDLPSKVYERAACQACADVKEVLEGSSPDEIENGGQALTGTGYLRTKKRRRKNSQ